MHTQRWMLALIGLLAAGLLAAGCGGDDETTTSTAGSTAATTTESSDSSETTADGASAEDVYNACVDAIEGSPVEDQVKGQCEQARDAFEQCAEHAGSSGNDEATEMALQICQKAADQAVKTLEQAGS